MAAPRFRTLIAPPTPHGPKANELAIEWLRKQVYPIVLGLMDGKSNATGSVTLTASATTTSVTDYRVGPESVILLMPTTTNAALEASGHLQIDTAACFVSSRSKNTFTITHSNDPSTNRTFGYAIVG